MSAEMTFWFQWWFDYSTGDEVQAAADAIEAHGVAQWYGRHWVDVVMRLSGWLF